MLRWQCSIPGADCQTKTIIPSSNLFKARDDSSTKTELVIFLKPTILRDPADADLLFRAPLEQRWQLAASRIGVDLFRLAGYSGHA